MAHGLILTELDKSLIKLICLTFHGQYIKVGPLVTIGEPVNGVVYSIPNVWKESYELNDHIF